LAYLLAFRKDLRLVLITFLDSVLVKNLNVRLVLRCLLELVKDMLDVSRVMGLFVRAITAFTNR
jgi:hypothetical protein